jgi:polyribonucleotide nucleotidyltransferase
MESINYDPGLEEKIGRITSNDGETLKSILTRLKIKLKRLNKPVMTINVITPTESKFREILHLISEYFSASEVIEGKTTGIAQYIELENILLQGTGLIVIADTDTGKKIPSDGWLHSQDQGMKDGKYADNFRKITTERNTHIILVRFLDSSDQQQFQAALGLNDFLDADIKCTT